MLFHLSRRELAPIFQKPSYCHFIKSKIPTYVNIFVASLKKEWLLCNRFYLPLIWRCLMRKLFSVLNSYWNTRLLPKWEILFCGETDLRNTIVLCYEKWYE